MSVFFLSSFFLSLSLSHRHSSSSFSSTAPCFHSEKRGLSLFLFILLYPSLPVSCQLLPATPCHRLLFGISQSAPRRWRNHTFVCPAPISLVWPQLFFFAKKKVIVLRHLFSFSKQKLISIAIDVWICPSEREISVKNWIGIESQTPGPVLPSLPNFSLSWLF